MFVHMTFLRTFLWGSGCASLRLERIFMYMYMRMYMYMYMRMYMYVTYENLCQGFRMRLFEIPEDGEEWTEIDNFDSDDLWSSKVCACA